MMKYHRKSKLPAPTSILFDDNVSWAAKGVFFYLMTCYGSVLSNGRIKISALKSASHESDREKIQELLKKLSDNNLIEIC